MVCNKDFYYIVFKDGTVNKCNSLSDFKQYPAHSVECYLYAQYAYTYTGPINVTDWFHFHFIDAEGEYVSYQRGNFAITAIGKDNGCTNFFGRQISIYDMNADKHYVFLSKSHHSVFVTKEIIPLLDKLNDCCSEDMIYDTLDKYSVVETYQFLKDKLIYYMEQCDNYQKIIADIKSILNEENKI